MSPITTHVLDTHLGTPAANLPIRLFQLQGSDFVELAHGKTNSDGRITDLLSQGSLSPGTYKMHFNTGAYHSEIGVEGFYPEAEICFVVKNTTQHYHIPLLLSPFGYSTYRGS
ncbi:MAG: hydroxyisourate hydrolase [Proteobacteria bacterium]|nr:hydroxyisourate hydrolase [Pseudomonadota bacterium]